MIQQFGWIFKTLTMRVWNPKEAEKSTKGRQERTRQFKQTDHSNITHHAACFDIFLFSSSSSSILYPLSSAFPSSSSTTLLFFFFSFSPLLGWNPIKNQGVRLMGVGLGEETGSLIFFSFLCLMGVSPCFFQ